MEYINHGMASPQSHAGTLVQGSSRVVSGNVVAYTNGQFLENRHASLNASWERIRTMDLSCDVERVATIAIAPPCELQVRPLKVWNPPKKGGI